MALKAVVEPMLIRDRMTMMKATRPIAFRGTRRVGWTWGPGLESFVICEVRGRLDLRSRKTWRMGGRRHGRRPM